MFVGRGDVFGNWVCNWEFTWDRLKEAPLLTPKGIQIMLKVRITQSGFHVLLFLVWVLWLLLYNFLKRYLLPDLQQTRMARHYRVNKKSLRHNKMNGKIFSFESTFKTVLVGGRKRVSDGRSGNWERSLTKLGLCPWRCVIRAIRGTESALWWAAADFLSQLCRCMPDIDSCAPETSAVRP